MASALSEKLSGLVKKISGQARITESNITDMLREVRLALLEADVALPVVRDFMARVKEQALGQEVLGSLTPGQALVGIVQRELAATMGEGVSDLNLAAQPPAVILMAGLQGAGKTTTTETLLGFRRPTSGSVSIFGHDPVAQHRLTTRLVGALLQRGGVWAPVSPRRVIDLTASYYDTARPTDELLERLGCRWYLPGEFGVRSEVNGYIDAHAALITPCEPQRDLIIL